MPKSVFGVKQPEDSLGFVLWRFTMHWQRRVKSALEPFGVTHPQFVILALVQHMYEQGEQPSQLMIIEKSQLDKMTVSASLKKLATSGCVLRVECEYDARSKLVQLTKEGRQLIRKLVPVVEKVDRQVFSSLSQSDQKRLKGLMLGCVGK